MSVINDTSHRSWLSYIDPRQKGRYLIFALFLVLAAIPRFFRLHEVGIRGNDTFQYIDFSERLINGEPFFMFYRPVAFLTNAISMTYFGVIDYAYLFPLAALDMVSIVLLFTLATLVLKNSWLGFSATLIYAFNPEQFRTIFNGYIHTHSTPYILLATLCFVGFLKASQSDRFGRSCLFLFLSGLALGLAGHTHEELAMIAAGFSSMACLPILYTNLKERRRFFSGGWLIYFIVYIAGLSIPYIVGILIITLDKILSNMSLVQKSKRYIGVDYFRRPFHTFDLFFLQQLIPFVSVTFLSALLVAPLGRKLQTERPPLQYSTALLCALIPLTYWFFYTFLLGNRELARLFIPFIPLCIVFGFVGLKVFFETLLPRYSTLIIVCIGLLFVTFHQPWNYLRKSTTVDRVVYNVLQDEVSDKSKLLLPVSVFNRGGMWGGNHTYGIKSAIYFGQDAVSLFQHRRAESLDTLIKEHKIRYALVAKNSTFLVPKEIRLVPYFNSFYDADILQIIQERYGVLISSDVAKEMNTKKEPVRFLLNQGILSPAVIWQLESEYLRKTIEARGGRKLADINDELEVYEIPRKKKGKKGKKKKKGKKIHRNEPE